MPEWDSWALQRERWRQYSVQVWGCAACAACASQPLPRCHHCPQILAAASTHPVSARTLCCRRPACCPGPTVSAAPRRPCMMAPFQSRQPGSTVQLVSGVASSAVDAPWWCCRQPHDLSTPLQHPRSTIIHITRQHAARSMRTLRPACGSWAKRQRTARARGARGAQRADRGAVAAVHSSQNVGGGYGRV